ncbi:protein insensitive-like [Choristoneura fumiferana]|uniref:protein insensitive-like n=1 Tax=Choristoneura fumiferana TaxID=7141 RepID=UPI003D15F13D
MEVEEPIAGPSGMCHQSYLCETVATMETEERTEVLVNGGVPIGSGKTIVPIDKFCNLRLKDFKFATRSLLGALFPKSVLATSSLTGKRSPAFTHLPPKQRLNPVIINDIVTEISKRYPGVTVDRISKIITTKCADEAKTVKKKKEGASSKVRERSGSSEEEEEEI